MDALNKAAARFCVDYEDFLTADGSYSVGYGLDPERKGPNGILVYAMHDDVQARMNLLQKARTALPDVWENFPVYFKGIPVPRAF